MDDLIRVLPSIVRAAGEAEEVAEAAVMVAWRRAAGDGLRPHAIPFRLYRKTLIVSVMDRTWQKQLEAMSGQLLFRINSLLGQAMITFIEFRIDPATVKKERAEAAAVRREAIRDEKALRRAAGALSSAAAEAIHDAALRRRFLLAAGSCLERREKE
ncbi:MAG TPA: DciA family protein [Pyrinomonadaceae bacterium]|jgi:hypothetical protein|nr:DciA family protein [Pyrinomonadaceae bacterium]